MRVALWGSVVYPFLIRVECSKVGFLHPEKFRSYDSSAPALFSCVFINTVVLLFRRVVLFQVFFLGVSLDCVSASPVAITSDLYGSVFQRLSVHFIQGLDIISIQETVQFCF